MQHEGLEELARARKISSYSVHKHLALLQQGAFVESVETRIAAGTAQNCLKNYLEQTLRQLIELAMVIQSRIL
jgi:hypothetical protein